MMGSFNRCLSEACGVSFLPAYSISQQKNLYSKDYAVLKVGRFKDI
jgi:hypothetical protein